MTQSEKNEAAAAPNISQFRARRRGSITADEFIRRLENDPEWVAERDRREAARMKRVEENFRVEGPILADLAHSGFAVSSIEDLCTRNLSRDEREVVTILLR